jgi:hypothetical protein
VCKAGKRILIKGIPITRFSLLAVVTFRETVALIMHVVCMRDHASCYLARRRNARRVFMITALTLPLGSVKVADVKAVDQPAPQRSSEGAQQQIRLLSPVPTDVDTADNHQKGY